MFNNNKFTSTEKWVVHIIMSNTDLQNLKEKVEKIESYISKSKENKRNNLLKNPLVTQYILMILLFFGFYWINNKTKNDYQNTIDEKIEILEKKIISPQYQNKNYDPTSNEIIDARLKAIENFPIAINNLSQSTFQQINFVFGITATFFALFSAFVGYRQIMLDNNKEKNEEKVNSLLTTVNQLMQTIKDNYQDQKRVLEDIENLKNLSDGLEKSQIEEEKNLCRSISTLNNKAVELFKDFIFNDRDRNKFKNTKNKNQLKNFYGDLNALQSRDIQDKINPFCYLLKALHLFNEMEYTLAGKALKNDTKTSAIFLAEDQFNNFTSELDSQKYPEIKIKFYGEKIDNEIKNYLPYLLQECYYHMGIINYNLGDYPKSIKSFKNAWHNSNKQDYKSFAYIPELHFFKNHKGGVKDIINKFEEDIIKEFKNVEEFEQKLKKSSPTLLASFIMKKGNCYLQKKPEDAFYKYAKAYQIASTKDIKGLTEIFIRFSLAQALENVDDNWFPISFEDNEAKDSIEDYITEKLEVKGLSSNLESWSVNNWKNISKAIFQDVLNELRLNISSKTEPILLVLLNYTLGICASKLNTINVVEISQSYLEKSREYLQIIPEDICIFSPDKKVNQKRETFIEEINEFEKNLIH